MIRNGKNNFLLLCLGGFSAGIANGLLGAGGGIIMTFVLSRILQNHSLKENSGKDLFANVILAILPITALSTVIYMLRGDINTQGFGKFLLPAVLGGIGGAFILEKIDASLVKKIFAVLVIFSGIYMVLK